MYSFVIYMPGNVG